MNDDIILDTKLVGDIAGTFYVPSYQRGYRWGKSEVRLLLDDIYNNGNNNYCLQPVVVKDTDKGYELIDGQQRLTTLYILLKYIKAEYKPRIDIKFELTYETRDNSGEFLRNMDESVANDNIDFFHMYQAYRTIDEWFDAQGDSVVAADDIYGYLVKFVKVIWYEVSGSEEDAIGLFTRLNIGKIPLTSSELVKAMFLCQDNDDEVTKINKDQIALQWDNIEKELHNESLWYFLTNVKASEYPTRIDIVLDLMSGKTKNDRDKYYTFFAFSKMSQETPYEKLWEEIQTTYLILKDWYEDHDLYHKIGYLISSNSVSLQDIYILSVGKTKSSFTESLDSRIKDSIRFTDRNKELIKYSELSYDKSGDWGRISRLLLLFNVESVRKSDDKTQRFPFDKFKYSKGKQVAWSLEHIHAQNSEGLRKKGVWKEWLNLHIASLETLDEDYSDLIVRMRTAYDDDRLERSQFDKLREEVEEKLSQAGSTEYMHCLANMALLNSGDNAALNNSTFDVKRNNIINMDKKGQYIPFCTKMVFLKYYTPSSKNQVHFWGQADRVAYINAINDVLSEYLAEKIDFNWEET